MELNSFIDEFVKARQKYFTPGQEWLEAELAEEKISVYMDKAQLEKDDRSADLRQYKSCSL